MYPWVVEDGRIAFCIARPRRGDDYVFMVPQTKERLFRQRVYFKRMKLGVGHDVLWLARFRFLYFNGFRNMTQASKKALHRLSGCTFHVTWRKLNDESIHLMRCEMISTQLGPLARTH